MNFKRFHESKNLVDISTFQDGMHLDVTTGLPTSFGGRRIATMQPIDVSQYNNITVTYDEITHTAQFMYSIFNGDTLIERVANKSSGDTIDTSNATKMYLSLYSCIVSDINYIMGNSGSTPEPYEPYSSEVWHDTPYYIMGTDTDTITTLPADIYANDITATVGLKGQMEQNGTPTPDSPITPSETGDLTGNLFDESNFALVQVTSTAYRYGTSLGVLSQGIYTFNATKSAGAQSIYLTAKLNDVYSQTTISTVPFSFTADGESEYIIRTASSTGTTWEAEHYSDMMLNSGSTALPYEPYGQYKIPILNNSQTTPVYLGEVESTRRIKKLVLTGQERIFANPSISASYAYYIDAVSNYKQNLKLGYCTHYPNVTNTSSAEGLYMGGSINLLTKFSDGYDTVDKFKTYLQQQYAAGTPVTVWYVLAEPTTGIVNEPLRKIGDYADSVSGITIPTTAGANAVDVLTTLKPSEVSVNYKGWHPVSAVHERESGQWD